MRAENLLMWLLVGGIAIGCVLVIFPFISALLWAGILVFSTWPVADWLHGRLRLSRGGAAAIMVLLTALVLLLPLALLAPGSSADVAHLRAAAEHALRPGLPTAPDWVFRIPLVGQSFGDLWDRWAADISTLIDALKPYFALLLEGGISLLLGIGQGVLLFVLALFIAFFLYRHGEPIAAWVRSLLHRIGGPQADRLVVIAGATVRGVVYGIIGTAVVQGILTAFGLWIAGVPRPVLLGALAGLLAVLPIGAPLVWIPAALWLLGIGQIWHGVFLIAYGIIAVSGADQVIRPWFIARGAQLPFMLTVLGVLGGAIAFGLLGIFLGPVLLAIGYALVTEWARTETTSLAE